MSDPLSFQDEYRAADHLAKQYADALDRERVATAKFKQLLDLADTWDRLASNSDSARYFYGVAAVEVRHILGTDPA